MIVLAMTDCPPRLRGDISKWLCEINTGVYVGNVSARVREELWSRVCKNLKNGRATLVYSSSGEQKMEFRVHNTSWTPVDFDGITLMRRPLPQAAEPAEELKPGFSKAAKRQMAQRRSAASQQKRDCFVVIDLETTGLHPDRDEILEYGAKRVVNGETTENFSRLVRCGHALPQEIQNLTGITEELLQEQGVLPDQALQEGRVPTSLESLRRPDAAGPQKSVRRPQLQAGDAGQALFPARFHFPQGAGGLRADPSAVSQTQ